MENNSKIFITKELFKVDSIDKEGIYKNIVFYNHIFTDASKKEIIETKTNNISSCHIKGINVFNNIDGITYKKIKVTDYSYIISCSVEKEYKSKKDINPLLVVKSFDICLKDKNDIDALNKARSILKGIARSPKQYGFDLVYSKDFRGINDKIDQKTR